MKLFIAIKNGLGQAEKLSYVSNIAGLLDAESAVEEVADIDTLKRQASDFDVVVLDWTGTPRRNRLIQQAALTLEASVLVLKGNLSTPDDILVCSGGRPIAEPVVRMGTQLALATKATITLLHVARQAPEMYRGLEAMDETLDEMMSRDTVEAQHLRDSAALFKKQGVSAVLELRHGATVEEILRSARRNAYDLVVVGASNAVSAPHRLMVGDVTRRVLDAAPCPVLVARSASHEDR